MAFSPFSQIREKIAGIVSPEIVEQRNELERQANTDVLTELPNRRAFDRAEPKARRDGLAFILFDANNFGLVNKQCGHKKGDEVLQRYADVIANVAHNFKARAFRYGGDEFVVVCPHRFAFKVKDAIEFRARAVDFGNFVVSLSGEVGWSVEDADKRLQARKQAKKRVG
ncbi:MAG: hypothetical protein JWM96_1333 [Alphaproteobacteria bacterium]|nr:hypothetical protein [Alphaproteobacteria bacterium]